MYHWQIQLLNSAGCACWEKSKSGEKTKDRREKRKKEKGLYEGDYRSAAGLRVMGWHEGQSRREEIDLLPSMMCFLLRPLSVSALQQKWKKCVSRVSKRAHIHMHRRSAWIEVIMNMPNERMHNKLPTNHWRQIHPLDAALCACSYRTKCAVSRCSGQTQDLLSLPELFTKYLSMTS